MSKIGVGIGEDFPADDSKPAEAPREDNRGDRRDDDKGDRDPRSDAEYAARREAYRKWREQRREWKRQWRDEWRARKRDFRARFHGSIYENYGDHRAHGYSFYWVVPLLCGVLGLIAVIALVSFVFSHIYVIAGAIALLALFAAYHRGHDPFDLEPHDDSHNSPMPPAPQREAAH
jgi:hypothetical protein